MKKQTKLKMGGISEKNIDKDFLRSRCTTLEARIEALETERKLMIIHQPWCPPNGGAGGWAQNGCSCPNCGIIVGMNCYHNCPNKQGTNCANL